MWEGRLGESWRGGEEGSGNSRRNDVKTLWVCVFSQTQPDGMLNGYRQRRYPHLAYHPLFHLTYHRCVFFLALFFACLDVLCPF